MDTRCGRSPVSIGRYGLGLPGLAIVALLLVAMAWPAVERADARSFGASDPGPFANSAQTVEASGVPTFRPVWLRHPSRLRAGSKTTFVLDPVSATSCVVTVRQPRGGARFTFRFSGGGKLARLTLRTRSRAPSGTLQLIANCAEPSGGPLTATATTSVKGSSRLKRGTLVRRSGIRVRRASAVPDDGAAGAVSGKGGAKNPFDPRQCTSLAWERRQDVYDRAVAAGVRPNGLVARPAFSEDYVWNGKRWAENARAAGIPTGVQPAVGALFVKTTGRYGHVAVVEAVYGDGTFLISERNASGSGKSDATTTSTQYPGRPGVEFVYGGPASGAEYFGHIVQWDGDTKTQRTAWYVISDAGHPRRNWIPDSATYYCLKRRGAPGPDVLPSSVLSNVLIDQIGVKASCNDGQGGSDPPPATAPVSAAPPASPTPAPAPTPPPPPATYSETAGSVAHTWTNHTNAGGTEGPTIAKYQTVQIACKLPGFRVADGNTWWYRIAQSPWNNAYYVSADAFYNNGATSGSLSGTPFVDPQVRDC